MRTPIVAGNWKMHYGPRQAADFTATLRPLLDGLSGIETILFPPFISLDAVHRVIYGSTIELGAQNVADQTDGAFTGEISAMMLTDICNWVLIGHSERRHVYGETDEVVNTKTRLALAAGLHPIVCVGETLEDREASLTERIINTQIRASLADLPLQYIDRLVVTYEPVWAIGTSHAASRQDAEDVIAIIRALTSELYGASVGENLRVLYGGSVTAENVADYVASPLIDGTLVGGASIKTEFADIARAIAATKAV